MYIIPKTKFSFVYFVFKYARLERMTIKILEVGAYGANCIFLWDSSRQAVAVDPGADADDIERVLHENQLTLSGIWLTHGHIDHISALPDLLKKYPVPVFMHATDAAWAFTPINQIPPYPPVFEKPKTLSFVEDGTLLKIGSIDAKVLHTPGHTPGCVCYYIESEKLSLTGDTLFQGSVGRTDLHGGSMPTLQQSLHRLMTLPEATRVIPGHGPSTTIGSEKRLNPFLEK